MIHYQAQTKDQKGHMLFVHGMCHGAWCWDQGFMQAFSKMGYHTYAINLKGHEKPGKNAGINRVSIEDYVEDVKRALDQIDAPTILVGHSMGGFVVQKYLEKNDNCQASILLGSVPYSGLLNASIRYIGRHPLVGFNLISRDIYGPFVKHAKELYYDDTDTGSIISYKELMRAESYKALIQMMFQPVRQAKPESVPMLCVAAQNDSVITPQEIEKSADFHRADFKVLDHVGHNMMLDQRHMDVVEMMKVWLGQLD